MKKGLGVGADAAHLAGLALTPDWFPNGVTDVLNSWPAGSLQNGVEDID